MTRVLVSMPDAFLSQIDKVAKEEGRTRSELIREAFRVYARHNPIEFAKAGANADKLLELLN